MNNPVTLIIALPPRFWSEELLENIMEQKISRLFTEIETIEKRIEKGINLSTERARYFSVCRNIEETILGLGYFSVNKDLIKEHTELKVLDELYKSESSVKPKLNFMNSIKSIFSSLQKEKTDNDLSSDTESTSYLTKQSFVSMLKVKLSEDVFDRFKDVLLASSYIHPPIQYLSDSYNDYNWENDTVFPYIMLNNDYVTYLRESRYEFDGDTLFAKSIFSPDKVFKYISHTYDNLTSDYSHDMTKKLNFFKSINENGWGVVEVQVPYISNQVKGSYSIKCKDDERFQTTSVIHESQLKQYEDSEFINKDVHKLFGLAKEAIREGKAFNIGNNSDSVLTEVLNKVVYINSFSTSHYLQIVYLDGSSNGAIRFGLPKNSVSIDSKITYNVGLMSMRHLTLDSLIDFYWFRNYDISKSNKLSEIESICYDASMKQFEELECENEGYYTIKLYQTGFDPAVVGFYKALVEVLVKGYKVRVAPQFYNNKYGTISYRQGTPWS